MLRILAFSAMLLASFPANADIVKTLGIHPWWDIKRMHEEFEKALVPFLNVRVTSQEDYEAVKDQIGPHILVPMQFYDDHTPFFQDTVLKLGTAARTSALPRDDYHFPHMDFTDLSNRTNCLAWGNGIEQRDDIAFVFVCFWNWSRQFIVAPFFRSDKVDRNTVEGYIRQGYGDHVSPQFDKWWVHKLGPLPIKYVFMPDVPKELQTKYGVSTAVIYFNADALEDIREANDKEREDEIKAAEKEKEKARKGL